MGYSPPPGLPPARPKPWAWPPVCLGLKMPLGTRMPSRAWTQEGRRSAVGMSCSLLCDPCFWCCHPLSLGRGPRGQPAALPWSLRAGRPGLCRWQSPARQGAGPSPPDTAARPPSAPRGQTTPGLGWPWEPLALPGVRSLSGPPVLKARAAGRHSPPGGAATPLDHQPHGFSSVREPCGAPRP